jgi:PAS domain S-box-containing protein
MDKPGRVEDTFQPALAAENKVIPIADTIRTPIADTIRVLDENHFYNLLNALPVAVYTTDAAGRITYYNVAATELWGHHPQLGTSEWCGSWKLYWPDGTPMPHEECPMALALKEKKPVRGMEALAERADGTRVPFLPYPTPLFDESGVLVGAINMLVDITERKRADEQQALLTRELHHRVKNTLATVQAIMGSTARSAANIEEFKGALISRIGSLAKTHLLLSEESGVIYFADIVHKELDAFDDGSEARVRLSGPSVELSSQLAVMLGMALHELTTNAAKFGALSVYGGKVEIIWSVTIGAEQRTLNIEWVESGGPPVTMPSREGFGLRLLQMVLPGQIQAKSRIEYLPEGLRVKCVVPLPIAAT